MSHLGPTWPKLDAKFDIPTYLYMITHAACPLCTLCVVCVYSVCTVCTLCACVWAMCTLWVGVSGYSFFCPYVHQQQHCSTVACLTCIYDLQFTQNYNLDWQVSVNNWSGTHVFCWRSQYRCMVARYDEKYASLD